MSRHAKSRFFKTPLAIALSGLLAIGGLAPANAVTSVGPASSTLNVDVSSTTTLNTALGASSDIEISGFLAGDLVRVVVETTAGGTLQLTSTANLTAITGYTLDTTARSAIGFTATTANANTALAGLKFIAGASAATPTISVVVSYAGNGTVAYYETNEHFYEFISTALTWEAARTAAAAKTFNGLQGYLATSTTALENQFITNKVGTTAAWLGGADGSGTGGVANQWRWAAGPELGKRFFDQIAGGSGGTNYTADGINYSNWGTGEPNGTESENALQIVSGSTGKWNDLAHNSQTLGYVVEYGGMAGDSLTYASTSRSITVNVLATTAVTETNTGVCRQDVTNATAVTARQIQNGSYNYCLVEFKNAGGSTQWKAPTGVSSIDLLVVGGGGSGGTYGGGGAGEFVEKMAQPVTAGSYYSVSVGNGGTHASLSTAGSSGAASVFDSVTASGGAGGGTLADPNRVAIAAIQGASGASSGGSVAGNADNLGVAGSAAIDDGDPDSFGNAGGAGYRYVNASTYGYAAGGGGGAGGAGGAGSSVGTTLSGGNGGAGRVSVITGGSYAGGGAGAANRAENTTFTTVNQGTASHGGGDYRAGAVANSGGGGRGPGSTNVLGGAGASGVVALRYEVPALATITTQPASASILQATTKTLTVAATTTDGGTISYQWQQLPVGGSWSDISGATFASYTTPALATSDSGIKYRAIAKSTLNGLTSAVLSNEATITVTTNLTVNVNFTELNFDYSNIVVLKKLNVDGGDSTLAGTTVSGTNSTGKAVGDRILFKNVTTRDGVVVDAIVTTQRVTGATVKNYESGTGAGGANSYFQADIDFSAANGYAEFKFDFYQTSASLVANCNASVDCAGSTKVVLQNVNVSAIDIDYYQWNDLTGVTSYTLASTTQLKECPIPGTGTCTVRTAPTTFPADVRAQGSSSTQRVNDPVDMIIANYGSIDTFSIKFGRDRSGSPNYYGVAFKALSWGSTTPATTGNVAQNVTLTYSGNGSTGGTAPTSVTSPVGTNATVAANSGNLVRQGYTFAGWNTAADGTGTAYAAGATLLLPNGGVTLYAMWVPSQFTLSYNANGGSAAPTSSLNNAGASVTLSSQLPTRSGYTFAGWNTLANGTGSNYSAGANFTMPGVNTTLYAKWTAAQGSIVYSGNSSTGGTVPATATGASGSNHTVLGNTGSLTRSGYTFAGWNTASVGTGTDYAAGSTIAFPSAGQTTTLYAQWTPVLYSLNYNANGGTNAPASTTQQASSSVTLPAAGSSPTRDGYTFAGWNTLANGSGSNYLAGASFTMPAANTTLYAKWTAINYNVTYNANAPQGQSATGSQSDTANYTLGAQITVASKGTLDVAGYRFVGWNTSANGTGTDYAVGQTFNMPLNGITLYAKWVLASIKLTYDGNGGNGAPAPQTELAGSTINLPSTVPTRPGYTFDGWCADLANCQTPLQPGDSYVVPSSDQVLSAKWTALSYSFIYNANGGSGAPTTVTGLNVGGFVTVSSTIPTRTGFTFLGWNALINGTGADYSAGSQYQMGAGNVTIYAKWQGDPFTLSYNSNGGTALVASSETRAAGSTANISASTPTRSGYTFTGWNTAANGSGTAYASGASLTMPGSNLTLFAQWSTVSNQVSYNANGGSGAPGSVTAAFGSTVNVSATVPTRAGFTFMGWNTVQGGTGTSYSSGDSFSMPATSVVLYAQWSTNNYTLSYDANGGSGQPVSSAVAFGATATVSSSLPTRNGYDFLGWNTAAAGTGTARSGSSTFTMPASNVTLYAQWSLATFTVSYNSNGGTGAIAAQAGRFGTTITLTSTVPTRPGFTFAGWNNSADGTGTAYSSGGTFTIPGSNVTLYAQWTAIEYSLTYAENGGNSSSIPAATTGKTAGQIFALSATVPTRSGYYFTGWNTQAQGGGQTYAASSNFTMPTANTTLYAQWTLNTYFVSYNANGGSGAPASQQTDGSGNVTVPGSTPTRSGYTFSKWHTDPSGSGGTDRNPGDSFAPGTNLVLYAVWTPNTIVVTYDITTGTGSAPATQNGPYGTSIDLAGTAGFSKANATFLGWNTIADGSGVTYLADAQNFALPSSNITLYAIWSSSLFAVEFDPNGGTNAPSDKFAPPSTTVVIPSTTPVKTGEEFESWTDVATGNTYSAGSTITMPTSNVQLVANWRASVGGGSGSGGNQGGGVITTPPTAPKLLTISVYFKGDSAVLLLDTKRRLAALARTAKSIGPAASITVIGRVKETNDKSYDARLSRQRAINVANFLKKHGATGTYRVIGSGISPENTWKSRRVDATLRWLK